MKRQRAQPIRGGASVAAQLWVGCVAGAMEESEYIDKLQRAGLRQVSVEPTRVYDIISD